MPNGPLKLQGRTPIEELSLPTWVYNALKRGGISTVEVVLSMSMAGLLEIRRFGKKAYISLHQRLAERGLIDPNENGIVPMVAIPFDEEWDKTFGDALKEALQELLIDEERRD